MSQKTITTFLDVYATKDELPVEDQQLVSSAYQAATNSYSPFSNFKVGCAVLLTNGEIVGGSNQENASYPAGICAERVALSTCSSIHAGVKPIKMAIVVNNENYQSKFPCAPCGICRQTISEYEGRFEQEIEIIFPGENGQFYKVKSIQSILPLGFNANNLK